MVISAHDTIRFGGINCFLVHAANKEKYSSIYCIAIAERASLVVDRPAPYSAMSRDDDDDVRDFGYSVLTS